MIKRILRVLNNVKLKHKLRVLYLVCVIVPIILTDGVVLMSVINFRKSEQIHEMRSIASASINLITNAVDRAEYLSGNIYLNQYLDGYLSKQYGSAAEYVESYNAFKHSTFFLGNTISVDRTNVVMYTDNATIIKGGEFSSIESIAMEPWFQEYETGDRETVVRFYYDSYRAPLYQPERKLLYIMEMDHFTKKGMRKLLKLELDYVTIVKDIKNMNFIYPVYICQDGKILLSNEGGNNTGQDFQEFIDYPKVKYQESFTIYGQEYQVYVLKKRDDFKNNLIKMLPLVITMLLFSVLIPWLVMNLVEGSIVERVQKLERAFKKTDSDYLMPIEYEESKDEIGSLMLNYNRMTERMNELIQTIYKDKMKEQDMNLAKKNAELLALHSQINPHFLFNALESIRMHSIIKEEYETADMVQRLAVMQRQYVDWSKDNVEIVQEMDFVGAYLELQKYRFGDRLSYELDVAEDCANYLIPKLTIVTFVENACIHGIESKANPGWVFVRVAKEMKMLCIEIEDTGGGIDEEHLKRIRKEMNEACIESIQTSKSVGIQNACLRIMMATNNQAEFTIESESGVGTIIQILIPLEKLVTGEKGE